MDVKTAFLNGNLEETIYMVQPEGFIAKGQEKKVCKLQKSIYGLKQPSKSWNLKFDQSVKLFGFVQSSDEPCVYKKCSGNVVVFLVLYDEDIRRPLTRSRVRATRSRSNKSSMSSLWMDDQCPTTVGLA